MIVRTATAGEQSSHARCMGRCRSRSYNAQMSEISPSPPYEKRGVDRAFELASWPARQMRGSGSTAACVTLAVFTLCYVFVALPVLAIVRWVRPKSDNCRTHPTRCRKFRFSLRSLLLLVTAICLWFGYHLNWIHQRREMRDWLAQRWVMSGSFELPSSPRPLPWSLRMLGEKPEQVLVFGRDPAQDDEQDFQTHVERARGLFPEARILEF